MECELDKIEKVVAVMTYGRGGSGLWSSLLDNHPNVLAMPDTLLINFYRFWKRNDCNQLNLEELLELFVEFYYPMFDAREYREGSFYSKIDQYGWTRLGENKNEAIQVDKEKFKKLVKDLFKNDYPLSRRAFLQAIHLAYTKCIRKEIEYPVIISFGLHIPSIERNSSILEDFPETVFLQAVREPIVSFASWFKACHLNCGIDHHICIDGFQAIIEGLVKRNSGEPIDRWKAVKLEDIHANPKESVAKVAKWLNLPWNDSLLESTWNGMKWWNEKNTIQVSGFSTDIINQKHTEYISWLDKIRFKILFYKHNKTWGYKYNKLDNNILFKLILLPTFLLLFKMEIISLKNLKLKGNFISKVSLFFKEFLRLYIDTRKQIWNSYQQVYDKNSEIITLL